MSTSKWLSTLIWPALLSVLLSGYALASSTWTLSWDWRPSTGPWRGKASVTLPEGDGPVTGVGTWDNHTYTSAGEAFQQGRLLIRGRVENDVLTFTPQFIVREFRVRGQKVPIPNPDPGLYNPGDTESIRVADGAETRSMSHGVPWVWHIRGGKAERWRITIDGWDRFAQGDQPKAIPRPKSLGKPSPWTVGTGKAAKVKYSEVSFGLFVHWRMVVDVEIEKGRYKRSTGRAFMVSDRPYCNPSGVYTCQSRSSRVSNSPFTVHRGIKSGQRLNLTLHSHRDQRAVLYIGYECRLDKLAAEMTIVKWKIKVLPNRRASEVTVIFPYTISVLLVNNWNKTEGQPGQSNARVYKVKRLR
jgi:hypothetical protein